MLQKRISDTIHSLTALAKNPLFLDTLIIDEVIAFYRDAIKRHRAQLLALVSFLSHKRVAGFGLWTIRTVRLRKA